MGRSARRHRLLPGQAAALAASLARLLDAVATEGASFARLADLAPADLAEHWQIVRKFLDILPQHWPGMLAAEGALDPADRRNRLLAQQAAIWRRSPPCDPVIAAGLTGGIPAMTELIAAVTALDRGAVILPGLDRGCDASAMGGDRSRRSPSAASDGGACCKALGLGPRDVRDWPAGDALARLPSDHSHPDPPAPAGEGMGVGRVGEGGAPGPPRTRRMRLIGQAMRPAATTDAWRDLGPLPADTLAGLSRYDCAGAHEEALTVALLLRRKLETPGATAALVTPDRDLARRVAAELRRWGIEIDDSAGLPLSRTPPGVFLRLLLDLAASGLAPVPMLAALKHPLAAGGLAPVAFRELTRALEAAIRGPRPAPGFAGLKDALARADGRLRRFADRLEACLGACRACSPQDRRRSPAWPRRIWRRPSAWRRPMTKPAPRGCGAKPLATPPRALPRAGRRRAGFPGAVGPPLPGVVRGVGRRARSFARPSAATRGWRSGAWSRRGCSRPIWSFSAASTKASGRARPRTIRGCRGRCGAHSTSPCPSGATGIAAHDFAQAIGAPEAALTRAARSEGAPTVPSRWLLRLDTVLRMVGLGGALMPEAEIEAAVRLLDAAPYQALSRPAPRPPLAVGRAACRSPRSRPGSPTPTRSMPAIS